MKDCTLYQHGFQDATRPADKANPQGLAINSFGDISHACRVFQETQGKSAKLPGMFRYKRIFNDEQKKCSFDINHNFFNNLKNLREIEDMGIFKVYGMKIQFL